MIKYSNSCLNVAKFVVDGWRLILDLVLWLWISILIVNKCFLFAIYNNSEWEAQIDFCY
jgi:hypothetical protein